MSQTGTGSRLDKCNTYSNTKHTCHYQEYWLTHCTAADHLLHPKVVYVVDIHGIYIPLSLVYLHAPHVQTMTLTRSLTAQIYGTLLHIVQSPSIIA